MANTRSAQLKRAMHQQQFVHFSRRFEETPIRGYILDVGPKFFLLALVSDRFWFDGFECLRIADVRDIRPDPYAAFAEAALRKRGERIPKKPRVSLAGIEELLLSAGRAFPLVTIHREQVDPEICNIGHVVTVDRGRLSLLEIHPDATWNTVSNTYRAREITRVNFGGDYEDALYLVGGRPEQAKARRR